MHQETLKTIIGTMRLKFLTLPLVVVVLSVAYVDYQQLEVNALDVSLVLMVAVFSHLAVNMLNEYQDWQSGLDSLTERTPFSGGSGSLQALGETAFAKQVALAVKRIALVSIGLTILIGLIFVFQGEYALLLFGIVGLLLVVFYTQYITRHPWLCFIAPGFAFGPLMMMGSYLALIGSFSFEIMLLSMIPFFLINTLLLFNQIPDREADQKVGRYNLWMALPKFVVVRLVKWSFILVFGLLIILVLFKILPWISLVSLVTIWWIRPLYQLLDQLQSDQLGTDNLHSGLGMNVMITHLIPVMIMSSLLLS